MEAINRLKYLSSQMTFEADAEHSVNLSAAEPCLREDDLHIHPAVMPNGRKTRLLKTLLTSACERNCYYCPFRAGRDFRRATCKPEEFAKLFMQLHRADLVDGLFISSGVAGGGIRTQEQLLDTTEILRNKMGFRGYIHLKIMPGAEKGQVLRGMQLADRVSVNLEAPNSKRLAQLAPKKVFMEELLRPLRWVEEIRRTERPPLQPWRFDYGKEKSSSAQRGRWPSSTTQFVAGGADESDLELLSTTARLYSDLHLARTYFMAFNPVPDTPMENKSPTPALRELRLYQASFLLRDYGFDLEELPFAGEGNLPLPTDPKEAWAEINLTHDPVEVNEASPRQLLRVPGIGPMTANRIVGARRICQIRDLSQLRKLGIAAQRAAPFILLGGKRMATQTRLF
ncbi:MAG: helix-hairpin-helix domain-containing protein [Anaerolineales bacterium]|nr:helix-hairpin-helix domain-containing protein [Anaerolineales bacterium]